MIKFLLIFAIVILVIFLHQNKIKFKWNTFFKKGFKIDNGNWGVYCYVGKQGQGKTYSVVEYLLQNKDKRIYSNCLSLRGVKYTPISNFDDLLALRSESDCIIFYDEIFTALTRQSSINTDVLDFLSQMRKRRIIFLTTAQEWLEINITLRRYCRYKIDCSARNFPFLPFSILIKKFSDSEQMKWSNLDNEYICPLLETSISKFNIEVANSYDTLEQIQSSNNNNNNNKNFSYMRKKSNLKKKN